MRFLVIVLVMGGLLLGLSLNADAKSPKKVVKPPSKSTLAFRGAKRFQTVFTQAQAKSNLTIQAEMHESSDINSPLLSGQPVTPGKTFFLHYKLLENGESASGFVQIWSVAGSGETRQVVPLPGKQTPDYKPIVNEEMDGGWKSFECKVEPRDFGRTMFYFFASKQPFDHPAALLDAATLKSPEYDWLRKSNGFNGTAKAPLNDPAKGLGNIMTRGAVKFTTAGNAATTGTTTQPSGGFAYKSLNVDTMGK